MTVYLARSAHVRRVAAAQARLAEHRRDPASGRCAGCGAWPPCAAANQAFAQLCRYGVSVHELEPDFCRGRSPRSPLVAVGARVRAAVNGAHRRGFRRIRPS